MQNDPGREDLKALQRLMRGYFADAAKLRQPPRRRLRPPLAASLTLILFVTCILLYFAARAVFRP